MKEIDASQWTEVVGGQSSSTAASAIGAARSRADEAGRLAPQAQAAALDVGHALGAPPDVSAPGPASGELAAGAGAAARAGPAGAAADRLLQHGRRSGLLLIELPEQDKLDLD